MCASRDRDAHKSPCQYQVFSFLLLCTTILIEKMIHYIEVTCFLIFDKKTRIL